jgi:hypothetical protein
MHANRGQEQEQPAHPDMGFLISCVCRRYNPSAQELDPSGVDWGRLTELAMRHRVLPILYQQVAEATGSVPAEAQEKLKDLYVSNAARNMGRGEEIRRLSGLCEADNLPVMCLRGPVLASSVYRDLSLRQFTDLDLLVQEQDVPRISSMLVSEGYRPQFRLDAVQERALIRFRTERCFIRSEDRSTVDLHWRLLPGYFSFEADETELWSRSVMTHVEGANVRTLADEDLFLFLCAHGAKHGWDQLALVCDLAEMMRVEQGLNWTRMLKRAESRGKRRMVAVGLELVRQVLGVTARATVRVDQESARIVDERRCRLGEGVGAQESGGLAKWSLAWRMMESARDRLAYAVDLTMIPTGIDCEKISLPRPLFPAYYLVRLGRMAGRLLSRRSDRQES